MNALEVLDLGRRFHRLASGLEAVVWSVPVAAFAWALVEWLGLSPVWIALPVAGVLAGLFVWRRFDEGAGVRAIEDALATDGAFELAVEVERGRAVPERARAAIMARLEAEFEPARVRRATWHFAPRTAIVAFAAASIGLVALGVARNLAVEERVAEVAGVERAAVRAQASPAAVREALEARRAELERSASEGAAEPPPSTPQVPDPDPRADSSKVDPAPPDLGPSTPANHAESAPDPQNLPSSGASGVTPGADGGKMVAPQVPAWWPRRHRAVVEAFYRTST